MNGHDDHGSGSPRPDFLPPLQGAAPAPASGEAPAGQAPGPGAPPQAAALPPAAALPHAAALPPAEPDHGSTGRPSPATTLNIMAIGCSVVLLVSAFLPWAHIATSFSVLGQTVGRDLGSQAGVDTDGSGQLIPVLSLVALGLITWGMIAHSPRIATYAAAPGGLAFLCCGIFVARLGRTGDRFELGAAGLGLDVSLSYGWFIALVAALLLVGLSLAALVVEPRGRAPHPGTARPATETDQS